MQIFNLCKAANIIINPGYPYAIRINCSIVLKYREARIALLNKITSISGRYPTLH